MLSVYSVPGKHTIQFRIMTSGFTDEETEALFVKLCLEPRLVWPVLWNNCLHSRVQRVKVIYSRSHGALTCTHYVPWAH